MLIERFGDKIGETEIFSSKNSCNYFPIYVMWPPSLTVDLACREGEKWLMEQNMEKDILISVNTQLTCM